MTAAAITAVAGLCMLGLLVDAADRVSGSWWQSTAVAVALLGLYSGGLWSLARGAV